MIARRKNVGKEQSEWVGKLKTRQHILRILPSEYELQSADQISNTKELPRNEMMTIVTIVNISFTGTIWQEHYMHHLFNPHIDYTRYYYYHLHFVDKRVRPEGVMEEL